MSWSAVTSLLRSSWVKTQSPIVVVLLIVLWMVYQREFNFAPAERKDNREAWQTIQNQMQAGFDRNLKAFSDESREWRAENKEQRDAFDKANSRLVESLLNLRQQQQRQTMIGGDGQKDRRVRDILAKQGLIATETPPPPPVAEAVP